MKKIFTFFSAFLFIVVSLLPYASVSATEVEWGDPVYIGTEEQKELGTKIALLNLLPDLIMNGVSDVTIDNSNNTSLDDYLLDLYDQLMEYSDEGLQSFIDEIDNRANDFVLWAQTYEDPIVDSTLSNFFSNGNYKTEYHRGNTLGYIDKLSRLQSNGEPEQGNPPVDYSFILTDNDWYISSNVNEKYLASGAYTALQGTEFPNSTNSNGYYYAWLSPSRAQNYTYFNKNNIIPNGQIWTNSFGISPITTIYVNTENGCTVTYSGFTNTYIKFNSENVYSVNLYSNNPITDNYNSRYWKIFQQYSTPSTFNPQTSFTGLSVAINYIHQHFRHYNLYVDGELWLNSSDSNNYNGILSTGGVSYIYNTKQPIQYYFSEPVQIDYQKLYELMVRAFQNGQPVDMTTINQGDVFINSNNTTIAPEADVDINIDNPLDGDFIGTLVGVMALPSFNSAMVQPLMQHVGSATVIATTYTSAIPSDIIELLGACLVISLFICIMHRMLE